jgi:hypothetical protein
MAAGDFDWPEAIRHNYLAKAIAVLSQEKYLAGKGIEGSGVAGDARE